MLCLSRFFWDIPDMSAHWFQIILNFLYVCQSGGWHTFLLKYDKFRDLSSSGWYIYLNFYGHNPGMLVHLFQIILNFLYICQSVSWLISLLKLVKYGDISIFGWDIFLKFFETFLGHWFTSFYSAWLSLHIDFWVSVCWS